MFEAAQLMEKMKSALSQMTAVKSELNLSLCAEAEMNRVIKTWHFFLRMAGTHTPLHFFPATAVHTCSLLRANVQLDKKKSTLFIDRYLDGIKNYRIYYEH